MLMVGLLVSGRPLNSISDCPQSAFVSGTLVPASGLPGRNRDPARICQMASVIRTGWKNTSTVQGLEMTSVYTYTPAHPYDMRSQQARVYGLVVILPCHSSLKASLL